MGKNAIIVISKIMLRHTQVVTVLYYHDYYNLVIREKIHTMEKRMNVENTRRAAEEGGLINP